MLAMSVYNNINIIEFDIITQTWYNKYNVIYYIIFSYCNTTSPHKIIYPDCKNPAGHGKLKKIKTGALKTIIFYDFTMLVRLYF